MDQGISQVVMKELSLAEAVQGAVVTVTALHGGHGFEHRLRSVGIREGKTLLVVARHPMSGPLVVEVDGRQISLGWGMAKKIAVVKGS